MTGEEAAWVRAHAWRPAHRAIDTAYPRGWWGLCSCQVGICGACSGNADDGRPRHDRCLSRQHGRPLVEPAARITDRRCMVVGPPVWTAGTPCRYICPCPCPKTGRMLPPPRRGSPAERAERSGQLDLFAEVTA